MFIVVLFIVSKKGNTAMCPSTAEQVNRGGACLQCRITWKQEWSKHLIEYSMTMSKGTLWSWLHTEYAIKKALSGHFSRMLLPASTLFPLFYYWTDLDLFFPVFHRSHSCCSFSHQMVSLALWLLTAWSTVLSHSYLT